MAQNKIVVRGAREHNLKNITVEIPRDKFVVITGLSGSGKSSLAFDTIYAEGQRRYVESLSAYARQFLGQMDKPNVDQIDGLSPAISIEQRSSSYNPRSTVGTVTEIYDYLRLLFARVGTPHCPNCGREVNQQSAQQIVDAILEKQDGSRAMILAPLVKGKKGARSAKPSYKAEARGYRKGSLLWPVKGKVTSLFGRRGSRMHDGIDISAKEGTPIHAAEAGTVVYADHRLSGYGKLVIIRHGRNLFTAYAHNQRNLVRKGAAVRRNDVIARVGHTGRASGAHLHFEVRHGSTPVDPLAYLSRQP